MKTDSTVLAFQHPDEIDDPLTYVENASGIIPH